MDIIAVGHIVKIRLFGAVRVVGVNVDIIFFGHDRRGNCYCRVSRTCCVFLTVNTNGDYAVFVRVVNIDLNNNILTVNGRFG